MLATVQSCAIVGLDGVPVTVEVDVTRGQAGRVTVVGLPDAAVRESVERVRSALLNSGCYFTRQRLTVNLAPANIRKVGPVYDLPIALGLLLATGQLNCEINSAMVIGELSLDGAVRHVSGILPLAMLARQRHVQRLFVPAVDAPEAALIPDVKVYAISSLRELIDHLNGLKERQPVDPIVPLDHQRSPLDYESDFSLIKGQEHAKRALEVAAAGGHNVLFSGPPGTGKTLMARSLPSILPQMTLEEQLEITSIYSVADQLPPDLPLMRHRPFRAPHHTISHAGLVGGGTWPRPGEISLAHKGVLFLDELVEFGTKTLETLRQPLEDKLITISRARGSLTFPANFVLVGAMNPCPCGYATDPIRECTCSTSTVLRYQQRISGPLMDRFDIHIEVPRVEWEKLASDRLGEPSATIRGRVEAARRIQQGRLEHLPHLWCNADMGTAEIRQFCRIEKESQLLLKAAVRQMQLSARAYHRILKLGRTIADLDGQPVIGTAHIAEALQYRQRRATA
ncbi:MAG: YifB family Mg chelatase-like AAA ATPase [Anaerolineales bacterium]|nr:YifB family Mg chelatase-like AAA ATPase [Anaerolineales bacterium]MCB9127589.1 YifB family Mg chelatase-like AAA ATPase [Ardenticatenales bacterium]